MADTFRSNWNLFISRIQNKEKNLEKKSFLRIKVSEEMKTKRKEGFLTALLRMIKKDPTSSIRKQANKLKVHENIVRTAIKQDFSTDLNSLHFEIRGVLESKTNATSFPNTGSLKTVIEDECHKMFEEFI